MGLMAPMVTMRLTTSEVSTTKIMEVTAMEVTTIMEVTMTTSSKDLTLEVRYVQGREGGSSAHKALDACHMS